MIPKSVEAMTVQLLLEKRRERARLTADLDRVISELETFLRSHGCDLSNLINAPNEDAAVVANNDRLLRTTGWAQARSIRRQIESEVSTLLKQHGHQTTDQLLAALKERAVQINTDNPKRRLITILSGSPYFKNERGLGWTFADDGLGEAPTEGSDTSMTSDPSHTEDNNDY